MKSTNKLTMEDAIAQQEKRIKQWERILSLQACILLRNYAVLQNKNVLNPYFVWRGDAIDNWIKYNLLIADL